MASTGELLEKMRSGQPMTMGEQVRLVFYLSVPAMLAQLSTILMQYIDASMVGRLGAEQSASIGLVSTSTWIFGGMVMATCSGFGVQVAHLLGAKRPDRARQIVRQALTSVIVFSILLLLVGVSIAKPLPRWLGGDESIRPDATAYFLIYILFLPVRQLVFTSGSILQASGSMKVMARMNVLMCTLDVIFNYMFIYMLNMGVRGAAFGTGVAEIVTAVISLNYLLRKSPELKLSLDGDCSWHNIASYLPQKQTLKTAFGISGPLWLQNIISRGAYVCSTLIVAPLGVIAIAANSFAIIAESFCYMPGYGMEDAATTLVGQSIGAGRRNMARRFALLSTFLGAGVMTMLAILMFIFAPQMMGFLTTDAEVIAMGARCLRIEAFAEFFYGVSIVAYGACVGAGDTLVASGLNFGSMWIVRIGLALFLTPRYGLTGYWIAMCIELNVRGILFLLRICGRGWLKKDLKL